MFVFSIAFIVGLLIFVLQTCVHIHAVRQGVPRDKTDHPAARLKHVMRMAFGQKRVMERWWGKAHAVIFYAFLVFLLSTLELLIESFTSRMWSLVNTIGITAVGVIHLIQTCFAWLTLIAVAVLLTRRIVRKNTVKSNFDAWFILSLIAILMISHIAVIAARIALWFEPKWLDNCLPFTAWISSFMNRDVAFLVRDLASGLHILAVSVFLVWIPMGKHLHILFAFPNLFFQYERYDDKEMPVLCMDNPNMDDYAQKLEEAAAKDMPESEWPIIGAEKIRDLKRRLILNALTCTRCQRCTNACPMVASDQSKYQGPMESLIRLRSLSLDGNAPLVLTPENNNKIGIISHDELWQCTQCGACDRVCPVGNENLVRILDLRRGQVCRELVPAKLNSVLAKFERSGNPWGYPKADRSAWKNVISNSTKNGDIHVVLFAGCMGAYDLTARKTLENCAKWLEMNGVVVHTLENESCCGEVMRKLGHEMEFAECMQRNLEAFAKLPKYDSIVTICPHCANTLKNEYPAGLRAKHFLEFVTDLRARGELEIENTSQNPKNRIHVPCGLGKTPQTPKQLIQLFHALGFCVSENEVVSGHCCGGGGGQFFLENSRKIAEMRVDELLEDKPEQIATCCPFCVQMLDSELKTKGSVQGNGDISLIPVSNVIDICIAKARRVKKNAENVNSV